MPSWILKISETGRLFKILISILSILSLLSGWVESLCFRFKLDDNCVPFKWVGWSFSLFSSSSSSFLLFSELLESISLGYESRKFPCLRIYVCIAAEQGCSVPSGRVAFGGLKLLLSTVGCLLVDRVGIECEAWVPEIYSVLVIKLLLLSC